MFQLNWHKVDATTEQSRIGNHLLKRKQKIWGVVYEVWEDERLAFKDLPYTEFMAIAYKLLNLKNDISV